MNEIIAEHIYDGSWNAVHRFIEDNGYVPVIGSKPHVTRESDGTLKVLNSESQIVDCKVGDTLQIIKVNAKGALAFEVVSA